MRWGRFVKQALSTVAAGFAIAACIVSSTGHGRSVDIGGRSLYIECSGTGRPTVLLEAGLTGDHRTWERVAPQLAADTRVCAYDRANIAPSDPAPEPRTTYDAVADLAALLVAAKVEPPYVLVGFSFGGLLVQLYAAEHPDDVAGIVLVESNHRDEELEDEAHLTPAQASAERAAFEANPEGIDFTASYTEVRDAGPLPKVPLVVVTAGRSDGWPGGWDADTFDRLRAELQRDLATLGPGGRQMIADRSGHHVPRQQPEVIVEAVRSVLAAGPADSR